MFKTKAFISQKIWGYERWIVSTHPAGKSAVIEQDNAMHSTERPLDEVAGGSYPLLIKIIQADETLSVQVHPDDNYAKIHENSAGKTECWYVLDAKPDATLVYGLNGSYSRDELKDAITAQTLDRYLRYVPVSKGDFIFIPAGTVHAIQGGLRLLEVQQSSDITYRLYDWGRPREVHIERGLDVIKQWPVDECKPKPAFSGAFSCPYFKLEKKDFSHVGTFDYASFTTPAAAAGWCSFFVIAGRGTVQTQNGVPLAVEPEDCIIAPTSASITVQPADGTAVSLMLMG